MLGENIEKVSDVAPADTFPIEYNELLGKGRQGLLCTGAGQLCVVLHVEVPEAGELEDGERQAGDGGGRHVQTLQHGQLAEGEGVYGAA